MTELEFFYDSYIFLRITCHCPSLVMFLSGVIRNAIATDNRKLDTCQFLPGIAWCLRCLREFHGPLSDILLGRLIYITIKIFPIAGQYVLGQGY